MRNSKQSVSSLIAVAGLMMTASNLPPEAVIQRAMPRQSKRRYYKPSMETSQDHEIAEWNAAVEAKRQAKKGRKP